MSPALPFSIRHAVRCEGVALAVRGFGRAPHVCLVSIEVVAISISKFQSTSWGRQLALSSRLSFSALDKPNRAFVLVGVDAWLSNRGMDVVPTYLLILLRRSGGQLVGSLRA